MNMHDHHGENFLQMCHICVFAFGEMLYYVNQYYKIEFVSIFFPLNNSQNIFKSLNLKLHFKYNN